MVRNKNKNSNNSNNNMSGVPKGGNRQSSGGGRGPMSSTGGRTKRNRRKLQAGPMAMAVVPLPRIYQVRDDYVGFRLKTSLEMVNTAVGVCSRVVAMSPNTISTAAYYGLGDLFPLLTGISPQYSRFMVGRCVVQLLPTTAVTSGGFAALGFEPDDTNNSGPPTSLRDCVSALNSDIAQPGEIASIQFNASDYFNDWRQTTAVAPTTISQTGVVQVIVSNAAAVSSSAAIFQIEVDIHFSGFRAQS